MMRRRKQRFLIFVVLSTIMILFIEMADSRKHRKVNEIKIFNHAEANIKIRCQSLKTDQKDTYIGPMHSYTFQFYDIDRGDMHFWCDAYGLFGFFETFDVFGRSAASKRNQTWFIKNDGLYYEHESNRHIEWQWIYPPFDSYAIETLDEENVTPLPVWIPFTS